MGSDRNRYEMMVFSAKYILEAAEDEFESSGILDETDFTFDMAVVMQRKRILQRMAVHTDNAILYQIRECLKKRFGDPKPGSREEEKMKSLLPKSIVYLDFADVFNAVGKGGGDEADGDEAGGDEAGGDEPEVETKTAYEMLEFLFMHGFTLVYDDGEAVTYVPFDKSASMSRESQITFVDRKLIDAVDDLQNIEKRVTLDIDFTKIRLVPSKYYAYRGLYFSDALRIPEKALYVLDEETVIVLKEDVDVEGREGDESKYIEHALDDRKVITYDENIFKETHGKAIPVLTVEEHLNKQAFDGEGLISPEYAKWLNSELPLGKGTWSIANKKKATSFQIRMPFVKGMLHQVDFHGFIKEFTDRDDLKIEDAFGKMRDLSKAQIILTASMFKCCKWLKEYADLKSIEDPMKFYFEKFHKYNHAFYVGNTNLNNSLRDNNTVKLNYQFINTLAMEEDAIEALTEAQIKLSDQMVADPAGKGRAILLNTLENDETDADGNPVVNEEYEDYGGYSSRTGTLKAWEYALRENASFIYDPYIKGKLESESLSLLKNIALGDFEVSGALEYLSDDLFMLLIYMILISDLEESEKKDIYNTLKEHRLYADRFYLADEDAQGLGLKYGEHYSVWRSPHLSRNEQRALKPYHPGKGSMICKSDEGKKENVYHKYFSHLRGVLMVGYDSDTALALGGADYDGDYVKIVTEQKINEAVIDGAYDKITETKEIKGTKKKEISYYKPGLPMAKISAPGGNSVYLKSPFVTDPKDQAQIQSREEYYKKICELAKDTFENKIGLISNRAIEWGRKAYFSPQEEVKKHYGDMCAFATVVTGLEMDAAKTGIHPIYKSEEIEVESAGRDFIDRLKKLIKPADPGKLKIKESEDKKGGLEVKGFAGKAKKEYIFSADEYKDVLHSNIDYLPYKYFKALYGRKDRLDEKLSKTAAKKDAPLFTAPKTIDDNKKTELGALISTFKKFNGRTVGLYIKSKNPSDGSDAIRFAYNIMRKRYDFRVDMLPETGYSIQNAAESAYADLEFLFENKERAYGAIDNFNKWKHSYAIAPEKEWAEIVLDHILGSDDVAPATKELLLQPTIDGYKLLYYLLAALYEEYKASAEVDVEKEVSYMAEQGNSDKKQYKPDEELYREMMYVYQDADKKGRQRPVWMEDIRSLCLERMNLIFDGDMNEALQYAHLLRGEVDESGSFFWTMFDTELVAGNMHMDKEDENCVR